MIVFLHKISYVCRDNSRTIMKYPIGIQDFESIINGGYVYVDKTALVYRLVTGVTRRLHHSCHRICSST